MRLHDLLDGLDVLDVSGTRGDLDVDVRSVVHDSREVAPGALFAASEAQSPTGTPTRRPQSRRVRSALLVERRLDRRRRPGAGAVGARARSARSPSLPRRSVARDARARCHRNERQDHDDLPPRRDRGAAGDRTGVIGTLGTAHRRHAFCRPLHTTPEATELQASLAAMRDAGVGTVAMEVSSHALEQHRVDATTLRGGVLHEPLARPSRLPRHDRRVLRGQGAAVHAGRSPTRAAISRRRRVRCRARDAARAAGTRRLDVRRSTTTTPMSPRASRAHADGYRVHARVASRRRRVARANPGRCSGRSTSPTARRRGDRAARRASRWMRSSPGSRRRSWCPAGWSRSTPGRRSRSSSTTRTRPTRSSACSARPVRSPATTARVSVVFGCGGDRDRAKRPVMGAVGGPARRSSRSSRPTTRGPRIRTRSSTTVLARRSRRRSDGRRARPPHRDPRARSRDAGPGDVVVIAGKGHETGQTVGGRRPPVRRPDRGARSAGGHRDATDRVGASRPMRAGTSSRAIPRRAVTLVGVRLARARRRRSCFVALKRSTATGTSSSRDAFRAGAHVALVVERPDARARAAGRARSSVADVIDALQQVAAHRSAPARSDLRRRRRHGFDREDVDEGPARRRAPAGLGVREPGVVQQRVRAADHAARTRPRDAGVVVDGDGGAVPRRRRAAVRHRPARRSASSRTSASRTPSTSAGRRASPKCSSELLDARSRRRASWC